MTLSKLAAGKAFPQMELPTVSHGAIQLGGARTNGRWQMIVVYRGKHCPICNRYLKGLEELAGDFSDLNVDVMALSGDGLEKAQFVADENELTFPIGYDLSISQMQQLGLYISDPRSPKETDQPFPEPALFVITPAGELQIVDVSNAPFSRPDLSSILGGIKFIQANDYPIRGMHL